MTKKNKFIFFCLLFCVLFFALGFIHIVLAPFLFSFVIAILANPILQKLEHIGINRSIASLSFIFLICILCALLFWFLFPILFTQAEMLAKRLPDFKDYLENIFFPKIYKIIFELTGQYPKQQIQLNQIFHFDFQQIMNSIVSQFGASTKFVFSWMLSFLITPIFMFFLMRDLNKIHSYFLSLVPKSLVTVIDSFMTETSKKLKALIGGQLIVITILSFCYSTAFLIVGLPFAIIVGVCTAIAKLIPYMDIFVGTFLCFFVLVTVSASNSLILKVIFSFLIVQFVDAALITPRVMGKFSGLHPFFVILSLICFGDWLGFYGVLLAIPCSTIFMVAYKMLLKQYQTSQFFLQQDS